MLEAENAAPVADAAPAPESAPAEVSARDTGPLKPDDLAGLFRAELEAEQNPQPAKAPEPVEAAPEPQSAPVEEAVTAEAEQQDGPATDPEPAAITAPAGMSEADKAVFATLPPEAKAWIAKREAETRADYTRKTQAVAEQRKQVEAAQAQVLERLTQYDQVLSQFTTRPPVPPDPALRNADPVAFEEQLAAYVHQKHVHEVATAEQARVRQERDAEAQRQMETYWQEQAQQLAQLAPELAAGTETARAQRRAVYDYGLKSGYSKEMMDRASALDMVTLWKAQRYDAALAAKNNAPKPAPPPAPKAQAPGPAKLGGTRSTVATAVRALSENPSRAALAAAYRAELAAER